MLALELLLGFAIGLSLGLLGGGGSILTVPALVYLVGQSPQAAVTTSLAIVGANSVLGASFHCTSGTLDWRVPLVFGGAGMPLAFLTGSLSHHFPPALLLVAFALLMIVIGGLMLQQQKVQATLPATPSWWRVAAGGAGVGALTGVLGVGGGFLIVPALVLLVGLPMQSAVGASLVVIAMNSVAGLLGHLSGASLDWTVTLIFVVAGLGGTFLGARLAGYLPAERLRQAFALFVLALAGFLLFDNVPKLFG
ncbi:MAG: sulfite exporter TauE/SafE family protein [Anaerolineales bacterium]|nr:sulfite exporter TauE/SafE family protein [Anaerolineales bacterium]